MVRLFHAYFPRRTLILALSEASLIVLALIAATVASFRSDAHLALTYENGLLKIMIASFVCILCMHYYDLYDSLVLGSPREVVARLIQGLGTTSVVLALLYYAYPVVQLGGSTWLLGIAMAGVALVSWREMFFVLNRSARLAERVVLLGDGPLASSLGTEIEKRPELGQRLLGYVDDVPGLAQSPNGLRRLGGIEDLPQFVESARIDRVIVTMSDRRGRLPLELLLQLKTRGVLVEDGADVYERVTGKIPLESLRLSWLVFSPGFHVSLGMRIYKRIFSFLFSFLGLVVSLPLLALISLAIRLDSKGPIIYRQQRLGKDGKVFTLFKFRSMRDGVDRNGNFTPATRNDDRFTRVGRWLRRTRLDELPQFYNILRGDMDFVGPRPFVPSQEYELMGQIPFYAQRLTVKPGATGWAQVNRGYCATLEDNAEKLAYDLFYIKNLSAGLDLLILFQTIKILLLGRGGR